MFNKSIIYIIISLITCSGSSVALDQKTETSKVDFYNATIKVDYNAQIGVVSKLLYGNNTKWLFNGEASFKRDNGIWNIKKNSINPAIKDYLKNSGVTILRYGDGTNADFFYWGWSILSLKKRLKVNLQTRWGGGEHYVFGIMEFVKLCELLDCEAVITINYGMGLLRSFYLREKYNDKRTDLEIAIQQAINLVEFLNSPTTDDAPKEYPSEYLPEYSLQKMPSGYFANLRKKLGYPNPIGIKYWEIGNEIYRFHAAGAKAVREGRMPPAELISAKTYTKNAVEFARNMKAIDPNIEVGIVEYPDKLKRQLRIINKGKEKIDFSAAHDYVQGQKEQNLVTYTFYGSGRKPGLSRKVTVKKDGTYFLKINAWGRAYFGAKYPKEYSVPAILEVSIKGQHVDEIIIDKNIKKTNEVVEKKFNWYELPVRLSRGDNLIEFRLANDFIDKEFSDLDRRGRDIFVNSIRLKGNGTDEEILWESPQTLIYSQLPEYEDKLKRRSDIIKKYAPDIYVAQTESAVFPNLGDYDSSLAEACMIMVSMDYNVRFRNFWHLYGADRRMGAILSGTKESENYQVTPVYLVIKLFSENFGNKLVKTLTKCPILSDKIIARSDISEQKNKSKQETPSLYARASKKNGRLYIAIVNLDLFRQAKLHIDINNLFTEDGVIYTITALNSKNYSATNNEHNNNVRITSSQLNEPYNEIVLPPGSFSILEYSSQLNKP